MSESIWPVYSELEILLPEVIRRWHEAEARIDVWSEAEAEIPLTRPAGWLRTDRKSVV